MIKYKKYEIKNSYDNKMVKPHKLGILARLYPDLTMSYITESVFNIYTKDASKSKRFESIESLMFDWDELLLSQINSFNCWKIF